MTDRFLDIIDLSVRRQRCIESDHFPNRSVLCVSFLFRGRCFIFLLKNVVHFDSISYPKLMNYRLFVHNSLQKAVNKMSSGSLNVTEMRVYSSAAGKMVSTLKQELTADNTPAGKIPTRASSRASSVASGSGASRPAHQQLHLLSLNEDVFQAILSHLSYDEIAKLRVVCNLKCSFHSSAPDDGDSFVPHRSPGSSTILARRCSTRASWLCSATTTDASRR